MQYSMQLISKSILTLILLSALGCALATQEPERIDIKDPGPKTQTYNSPFAGVWKACLIVLGKYPLKSYDEESGIIETDYLRGEDVWIAPHRKKYVAGGFRYKLNLRVIKGRANNKPFTKVIIVKQPELQKDFFSDAEKLQTDGLEELSILYRVERELALDQALAKVQRNN
jgi:hypothetical protein